MYLDSRMQVVSMIFKDRAVFDPDYVPEQLLFRDLQLRQLKYCIEPALSNNSPLNALCLGPPSTGKTSTIKHVLRSAGELGLRYSYIRSPRFKEPYRIFAKIFWDVFAQQPPSTGISKALLMEKIWKRLDSPLIVVLDDLNFLSQNHVNEILYEILKAPDEFGVKVGIIAAATDIRFPVKLDPFTGSIFHYTEILYPIYDYSEIREILRLRAKLGFYENCIEDDAFERVVELAHRSGDVRYGIFLLKTAGMIAESRRSDKITLEDVERANEGESIPFLVKILSALNSEERAVLRIVYSHNEISTGELYELICREVRMSYRKFYNVLEKLERLKLVDVVFGEKGRGKTRYVYPRFDTTVLNKALEMI
ncbi:MAG: ORC1-type DNA replication protein [Archaeoglobaceae archaeon]